MFFFCEVQQQDRHCSFRRLSIEAIVLHTEYVSLKLNNLIFHKLTIIIEKIIFIYCICAALQSEIQCSSFWNVPCGGFVYSKYQLPVCVARRQGVVLSVQLPGNIRCGLFFSITSGPCHKCHRSNRGQSEWSQTLSLLFQCAKPLWRSHIWDKSVLCSVLCNISNAGLLWGFSFTHFTSLFKHSEWNILGIFAKKQQLRCFIIMMLRAAVLPIAVPYNLFYIKPAER